MVLLAVFAIVAVVLVGGIVVVLARAARGLLDERLSGIENRLDYRLSALGERVDAVIKVERLIPVDAKFPLDNFERMVEAEDEAERAVHEKAFARDLKGHIDSVASKYIKPADGTYEFAFMYLPAEGIYYEL